MARRKKNETEPDPAAATSEAGAPTTLPESQPAGGSNPRSLQSCTVGEMTARIEESLAELDAFLTAARAVAQTCHDIARAEGLPIIDKHMNALDAVLDRAVYAQNSIWSVIDCVVLDTDDASGSEGPSARQSTRTSAS